MKNIKYPPKKGHQVGFLQQKRTIGSLVRESVYKKPNGAVAKKSTNKTGTI